MAITTLKGHVQRALDFFNKNEVFFVIGKTTSWTEADRTPSTPPTQTIDDNNPPVPENTDDVVERAGYKAAESRFVVIPDDVNGTIVYRDTKWRIVPANEAMDEGARYVYLATYVAYQELPINISYRQVGVTTSLTRGQGVPPGKSNLLPAEVEDPGILEVLDNRKPIYREADQREQLAIIMEF